MDGWNTNFPLGWPIFRGELLVSGRVPPFLDSIQPFVSFSGDVSRLWKYPRQAMKRWISRGPASCNRCLAEEFPTQNEGRYLKKKEKQKWYQNISPKNQHGHQKWLMDDSSYVWENFNGLELVHWFFYLPPRKEKSQLIRRFLLCVEPALQGTLQGATKIHSAKKYQKTNPTSKQKRTTCTKNKMALQLL